MGESKYYIPVEQYRINNLYEKQTDDKLSFDRLVKDLKIKITSSSDRMITFEMKGVDVSLAHSIKKAAWGEVPTMAIDKIEIIKNTSAVPEETLLEQFSYVTFNVDPKKFNFRSGEEEPSNDNAVMFEFTAKNTTASGGKVFSKLFKWIPIENQTFPNGQTPKPIDSDQLLMLLDAKHELSFKAYCFKGIGNTHAKFSPAPYSNCVMAPVIRLKRRFEGDEAHELKSKLPQGSIEIKNENGVDVAVVSKSKNYVHNRNIFMHEEFRDDVELFLHRQHFLFTFEGTGVIQPKNIVIEALEIQKKKCKDIMADLNNL